MQKSYSYVCQNISPVCRTNPTSRKMAASGSKYARHIPSTEHITLPPLLSTFALKLPPEIIRKTHSLSSWSPPHSYPYPPVSNLSPRQEARMDEDEDVRTLCTCSPSPGSRDHGAYDHDDHGDRPVAGWTPRRDHGAYDHDDYDDRPVPGRTPTSPAWCQYDHDVTTMIDQSRSCPTPRRDHGGYDHDDYDASTGPGFDSTSRSWCNMITMTTMIDRSRV